MRWLGLPCVPPEMFYFLISSCVIAALAEPPFGDIIIVITTSSSSCRQIILLGSFFNPPSPFFLQLHRWGEITFFTKPLCCLYCDSGHTSSHSLSLSYKYATIGVMVKKRGEKLQRRGNGLFTAQSCSTFSLWIEKLYDYLSFPFNREVVQRSALNEWVLIEGLINVLQQ